MGHCMRHNYLSIQQEESTKYYLLSNPMLLKTQDMSSRDNHSSNKIQKYSAWPWQNTQIVLQVWSLFWTTLFLYTGNMNKEQLEKISSHVLTIKQI